MVWIGGLGGGGGAEVAVLIDLSDRSFQTFLYPLPPPLGVRWRRSERFCPLLWRVESIGGADWNPPFHRAVDLLRIA